MVLKSGRRLASGSGATFCQMSTTRSESTPRLWMSSRAAERTAGSGSSRSRGASKLVVIEREAEAGTASTSRASRARSSVLSEAAGMRVPSRWGASLSVR